MTDTNQLAATVRAQLERLPGWEGPDPLAALDELVALAGRAQEDADGSLFLRSLADASAANWRGRAEAAEVRADELEIGYKARGEIIGELEKQASERIAELERERDKANTALSVSIRACADSERDMQQARREADQLRAERDALMADAVKNVQYWKDKEYDAREKLDRLANVESVWELLQQNDQLRAALRDLMDNIGGHEHWDSTGMHGAGCMTCAQQREAKDRARAALAGVQAKEEQT